jgi:DNA-binding NarL/FixJ family response regulator
MADTLSSQDAAAQNWAAALQTYRSALAIYRHALEIAARRGGRRLPPVGHLDEPSPAQTLDPALRLEGLSPREWQVAELVARGYTNQQIADALVLTRGTVANHVAHVLGKLGLSNRTQVAARIFERRAVTVGEVRPVPPVNGTLLTLPRRHAGFSSGLPAAKTR